MASIKGCNAVVAAAAAGATSPAGLTVGLGQHSKERALRMYTEGSSLSATGRTPGYSVRAVSNWVKGGAYSPEAAPGAEPAAH